MISREKNKNMKRKQKQNRPRSTLPKGKDHIPGWPREHYNEDRTEKLCYKNKESAKRAAETMTRIHCEPIEAYECPYCGCWHIGHRPLLPLEQKEMILKKTIEGELSMLKRYRDDINTFAKSALVLMEKLDHLEYKVKEHYSELYMLTYQNKHQNT